MERSSLERGKGRGRAVAHDLGVDLASEHRPGEHDAIAAIKLTLTVAAIPCEVFVEIGLDLKKNAPLTRHFTISLANGYNGYLPTAEHHKLGGYETWRARSSYLEVEAADKITARLKAMLAKFK
mgnify:CR=1 FL=1